MEKKCFLQSFHFHTTNKTALIALLSLLSRWCKWLIDDSYYTFWALLKPSRPDPGLRDKINLNFYFQSASKVFMKALKNAKKNKIFIKSFEEPQRSVKIKILVNFYFNAILTDIHWVARFNWQQCNGLYRMLNPFQVNIPSLSPSWKHHKT